jgi:hypothetical protein
VQPLARAVPAHALLAASLLPDAAGAGTDERLLLVARLRRRGRRRGRARVGGDAVGFGCRARAVDRLRTLRRRARRNPRVSADRGNARGQEPPGPERVGGGRSCTEPGWGRHCCRLSRRWHSAGCHEPVRLEDLLVDSFQLFLRECETVCIEHIRMRTWSTTPP